jgi:cation transport ATPase
MPYCSKCGKEVKDDAVFCPFCGESLKKERIVYMQARDEKDERNEKNEKDEKNEKGEKNEKSEKNEASGGMWSGVMGGLILLWLGVSFLLRQYNYVSSTNWWNFFLIGLGIIIILRGVVMYIEISNWRASSGFLIGGGVVTLIGAGSYLGLSNWWALLLILVGGWVIISALTNKGKHPRP